MTEDQIKQIIQNEIKNYMDIQQYNFGRIQSHSHDGVDSPLLKTSTPVVSYTIISGNIQLSGTSATITDARILSTSTIVVTCTSTSNNTGESYLAKCYTGYAGISGYSPLYNNAYFNYIIIV